LTDIRACTVAEANALYKAAGYSGRAAPGDTLTGAYRCGRLVAAARLVSDDGQYLLLRNLCTLPEFRRQGAAMALCIWLRQHIRQPIIVFPLPELISMYSAAGFYPHSSPALPVSLEKQWQRVKRKYPTSIVMSSEQDT